MTNQILWLSVLGVLLLTPSALASDSVVEQDKDVKDCSFRAHPFFVRSGGVLALDQGTRLTVEPDSLEADTVLWVEVCRINDSESTQVFYHFGESGTTFDPPATVVLQYGAELEDSGDITPYYWDPELQQWIVLNAYHDVQRHRFTVQIHHFSLYAISTNRGEIELEDCPW